MEAANRRIAETADLGARFVATMSHELRSPLNGIIGLTELMEMGRFGPVTERQQEALSRLLASGEHLLKLINNTLDLAKSEAGTLDFAPEDVPLRDLAQEVVGTLQPAAAGKSVCVQVSVAEDLEMAFVDPTRLRQVLFNYLSNAIKFSPPGAQVQIRLSSAGADGLRIEVEDAGPGISQQDLAKLFREFGQLPVNTSPAEKGTGLGLAITKRIVESQGGEVGVTSSPGHGSTFFAVLPPRHLPD